VPKRAGRRPFFSIRGTPVTNEVAFIGALVVERVDLVVYTQGELGPVAPTGALGELNGCRPSTTRRHHRTLWGRPAVKGRETGRILYLSAGLVRCAPVLDGSGGREGSLRRRVWNLRLSGAAGAEH
jgi:hypothetical protein